MAEFSTIKHKFTTSLNIIDYNTGEEQNYGKCVKAIAIKKSFGDMVFPLYVLNLSITKAQRNYLAKNKFYVSLKIMRCVDDENMVENLSEDSDVPVTDKIICDIILRPFDNSKNVPLYKTTDVDNNEENLENQLVSYDLNCVPKEQLKINNSILNYCYAEANLNEIIINLLSEVYSKDVYFQESSNITRYDSLLIPPMSIIESLKYLQKNYLVYDKHLNIFFEDSKLYIYDMYDTDREFRNGLYVEVKQDNDDDQTKYRSNYIDKNDNLKKYLETNPQIVSVTDTYRYETGEQVVYCSYDDNFNLVTRTYQLDDTGNTGEDKKTRYIWNDDKLKKYEIKNLSGISNYIQLSFSNLDPSLIEPDTFVEIVGGNELINGVYCILGMEEFFASSDYTNFTNSFNVTLGKIK